MEFRRVNPTDERNRLAKACELAADELDDGDDYHTYLQNDLRRTAYLLRRDFKGLSDKGLSNLPGEGGVRLASDPIQPDE